MADLLKDIHENTAYLGIVFSFDGGIVNDVDIVNYNNPSVVRNNDNTTAKMVLKNVFDHGTLKEFSDFVRKNYHGKMIYDEKDKEEPGKLLFGPFTIEKLQALNSDFLEHIGYDQEKAGEDFFGKEQWKRERNY